MLPVLRRFVAWVVIERLHFKRRYGAQPQKNSAINMGFGA